MANLLAVHEALLYNEGSPQYFLWYPAHISPILLGLWYQILHLVGLLPEYKLSSLPATATADQFDATWQKLVALGYVSFLSLAACCTRLDSAHPAAHRLMASCSARRCSPGVLGRNRVGLSNSARLIRNALLSTRLRGVAIDVHRGERDWKRGGFSIWGWPASSWALH